MAALVDNTEASFQRILVVRLGAMGDVIHTLPAVAALRALFPNASIGWAVERRWMELLCSRESDRVGPISKHKPLVDMVHLVNTKAWRTRRTSDATWKEAISAFRELRQTKYDLVLDFQGAWKSALAAILSGAPLRVGFRQPRERGASVFYHRTAMAEGEHIVEQNVSLLAALAPYTQGAIGGPPAPELPWDECNELRAEEELGRLQLQPGQFAMINPGAGWGAKCWPAERYAEVARGLGEQGMRSLINFGPGEERLARAVEEGSSGAAQALQGSIGELMAVMRRARLFIGGDTGPMHLAAALRVPVVAVFGPTNPARNGPYATEAIVLRSPESLTDHSRRAEPEAAMLSITAAEVLQAARTLLDSTTKETYRA